MMWLICTALWLVTLRESCNIIKTIERLRWGHVSFVILFLVYSVFSRSSEQITLIQRITGASDQRQDDTQRRLACPNMPNAGYTLERKKWFYLQGHPGYNITIDTLCDIMADPSQDHLTNYARVNSLMMKTYEQKCLDFTYKSMIKGIYS